MLQETYPICTGQRLTINSQRAERRMGGQALVPLARLRLWDSLHKGPLELTDAGMMSEQVLVRFIELLRGA